MKTPNNTLATPCFIFDRDEMERGIDGFASALSAYFPKSVVGYSVKTNSLPRVLETVRDGGCYAEVVSYTEYALAKNIGFAPRSIIYNGPLKSQETFAEAVLGGAMVNIETWREIEWLRELAASVNCTGGGKMWNPTQYQHFGGVASRRRLRVRRQPLRLQCRDGRLPQGR